MRNEAQLYEWLPRAIKLLKSYERSLGPNHWVCKRQREYVFFLLAMLLPPPPKHSRHRVA